MLLQAFQPHRVVAGLRVDDELAGRLVGARIDAVDVDVQVAVGVGGLDEDGVLPRGAADDQIGCPARLGRQRDRRQRRMERYEQVVSLLNSGQSQVAIARALGMERKTIRRWLRRSSNTSRPRSSVTS